MRKTRLLIGGLGVLAVIGAGYAWSLQAQPKNAPSQEPRTTPMNVSALGRLEPHGEMITLAAPTATEGARVEKLFVKAGDHVQPGQVLAQLDLYERRATAVREAEARVDVAKAKLVQVKAGAKPGEIAAQEAMVARADADLKKADEDLTRAVQLRGPGTITKEEFDTRKQQREAAAQTLRHAREMLTSLREVRAVDIAYAEAEIRAAEASVRRAVAELDAAQVRALTAGQVIKIYAQPGERVGDKGILEMGDTTSMFAIAEVYEADILRVRHGQTARVRMAGIDGELQGQVTRIGLQVGRKNVLNNDPVADTDARVVEVFIQLDAPSSKKVAGLSNARVDVVLEGK
jgi:HlyD family secretion protein